MDKLTQKQRSALMARIRSRGTGPERAVRALVRQLGFRATEHCSSLPGCPDLVIRSRRCVIFVHGCFWHAHSCRAGRNVPATNTRYWTAKRERNVARDRAAARQLRRRGWSVITVWECELKCPARAVARLRRALATA